MFCEGTWLRSVRTLVSRQMNMLVNAITERLTGKKANSWSLMSGFALRCWKQQHDGLEGFEDGELAKLHACSIYSIEQVAGIPNGELLLIHYREDAFAGLNLPQH